MTAQALNHRIRLRVLEQCRRARVGHIGSALSVADILAALYGGTLREEGRDRERFILSKGHAAAALYAALYETERLDREMIESYCTDGTPLGAHPEHAVDVIDFSTGSLGHGLSIAAGAALAARLEGSRRRTFVLLSDAELNEGSTWEAVMFASHQGLGALVAIVDVNGQQAMGYTRQVMDLEPLEMKWRAFGWDVRDVDGHDVDGMRALIDSLDCDAGRPHVLLARTTFGRGVSFMENQIGWHYWPLTEEQYVQAVDEVNAAAGIAAETSHTR